MSSATLDAAALREAWASLPRAEKLKDDLGHQAFLLLRLGFVVAPILLGADKFVNVMVNSEKYLAPWIGHLSPLSATHTMYVVGAFEIIAGLAVALKSRYAAYLAAGWLAGIIANLLPHSGWYDFALRDFGLLLAALTLARLASKCDPPGLRPRVHR
jgi:uncharacterized membrane protein YphA (DoxX/SURF4 family)